MTQRVVITGLGVLSPIGNGAREFLALVNCRDGRNRADLNF